MTALATEAHTKDPRSIDFDNLLLRDAVAMLRVSWGLSLASLAARAGLRKEAVHEVEQGEPAGFHALERLADAFDLPSERLAVLTPGRSLPTVAVTNDNDKPPSFTEAGEEGSWTWHFLPTDEDPWALELCNEGGVNLEEIGRCFGRSRAWAHSEITRALGKISEDPDFAEVEDYLR